jgi:hypothetical protein
MILALQLNEALYLKSSARVLVVCSAFPCRTFCSSRHHKRSLVHHADVQKEPRRIAVPLIRCVSTSSVYAKAGQRLIYRWYGSMAQKLKGEVGLVYTYVQQLFQKLFQKHDIYTTNVWKYSGCSRAHIISLLMIHAKPLGTIVGSMESLISGTSQES